MEKKFILFAQRIITMTEPLNIKLNGITKHPGDKTSNIGDLDDSINVENVYGEIRTVLPVEKTGGIRNLLFVHRYPTADYLFYQQGLDIRVSTRVGKAYVTSGDIVTGASLTSGETITGVEAIGNIVVITSTLKIRYLLHKDAGYQYLGNQLPFPIIQPVISTDNSISLTGVNATAKMPSINNLIRQLFWIAPENTLDTDTPPSDSKLALIDSLATEATNAIIKQIATNEADGYFTYPFFVRYALRMYDGTLTKHSPPILINPGTFTDRYKHAAITFTVTAQDTLGNALKVTREKLRYQIAGDANITAWADIISSVDVFISKPLATINFNEKVRSYSTNSEIIGGITNAQILNIPYYDKDKLLSDISSEGNFYLLESVELSKLTTSSTIDATTKGKLSAIVQQERMTDDYETHHRLRAEGANAYNNRLILCGVTKEQYDGFYSASGNVNTVINGKELTKSTPSFDLITNSMYLFYPDNNATQIKANTGVVNSYFVAGLKRHPSLNGSYYINPELKTVTYTTTDPTTINTSTSPIIEDVPEKLYSSEINNPFLFRPAGISTMPGRVLGVATTTEPLSQGQFGQHPLYVFTDKGIWAMEIANTGAYSSKQTISREVCTNPKSITQLKREVAFITAKGLCIISGANTELITSVLEDANYQQPTCDINSLLTLTGNTSLAPLVSTEPTFTDYMQGAKPVYDPLNERIYLYNPTRAYSYIFNLQSKTWSKINEQFLSDCNAYPEVFFEKSDGIYQPVLSSTATTQRKVFFITRPIQLQELMFIVERLRLNGTITKITDIKNVLALYASRDGVTYNIVAATETNMLKMRGSGYKFYKIAFSGTMKNADSITGLTAEYKPKLINKLR